MVNQYRFVEAFPRTIGYGPALAVTIRETGRTIGYVRRVEPSSPTNRTSWLVYDEGGKEIGVSDLRQTAANFLRRQAEALTDPA